MSTQPYSKAMNSMTGFGKFRSESSTASVEVSVKTVNGRYLDVRFSAPRQYLELESSWRKLVAEFIDRSSVDIFIHRKLKPNRSELEVQLNLPLAQKWMKAYTLLAHSVGIKSEPSVTDMARIPEIFALEEQSEVSAEEAELVASVLKKALSDCQKERAREGKALARILAQHLQTLTELLDQIAELREQTNLEVKRRLEGRLARLKLEFEPQRVAQELAFYLDRLDIAEEIDRLREHLRHMAKLLESAKPVGKKLDFYNQELLREMNTIGAKAQLAPLSQLVVEAKAVIERIKEQVQNVE